MILFWSAGTVPQHALTFQSGVCDLPGLSLKIPAHSKMSCLVYGKNANLYDKEFQLKCGNGLLVFSNNVNELSNQHRNAKPSRTNHSLNALILNNKLCLTMMKNNNAVRNCKKKIHRKTDNVLSENYQDIFC